MTDDARGPKDPGPQFRIISCFASFVMQDDEDDAAQTAWLQTLEQHGLAILDAEHELEHFNGILNHMSQVLADTGYHEIKRLRKASNEIAKAEWKLLEPIIESLRSRGFEEIVELVYRVRGGTPARTTVTKHDMVGKIESLKQLAARAPSEEADSALKAVEKLSAKHQLPAKPKSPFDFGLEDLEYVEVKTPVTELNKALDAELTKLQKMADIFYSSRDNGRQQLERHYQSLIARLDDPHQVSSGVAPIITVRRSS